MTILSDKWIKKLSLEHGMISPFVDKQESKDKVSFGLSSFGYDVRVSDQFKVFTDVNSQIVDLNSQIKASNYCISGRVLRVLYLNSNCYL